MSSRSCSSTRPRAPLASLLTLLVWAATVLAAPSAHAMVRAAPAECPVRTSAAASTAAGAVAAELSVTEAGLRGATPGSPAEWRLREEAERLAARDGVLGQLSTALAAREGATPASPAEWPAVEDSDALCQELQLDE